MPRYNGMPTLIRPFWPPSPEGRRTDLRFLAKLDTALQIIPALLKIQPRIDRKRPGAGDVVTLVRSGRSGPGDIPETRRVDIRHRVRPIRSIQYINRVNTDLELLTFSDS